MSKTCEKFFRERIKNEDFRKTLGYIRAKQDYRSIRFNEEYELEIQIIRSKVWHYVK